MKESNADNKENRRIYLLDERESEIELKIATSTGRYCGKTHYICDPYIAGGGLMSNHVWRLNIMSASTLIIPALYACSSARSKQVHSRSIIVAA